MIKKGIFIILMCFTMGIMSCSPDDDHIETPTYATGGDEVDDPAEPDEDQ